MVLLRAPLGRRGSYIPTAINALQCLGWATFELIIIAAAAAALSDELLGVEARSAWTIFFGCVAAALALMGPIGVVRRFLRRFALWAVLASLVYLTWWTLFRSENDLDELWARAGTGDTSIWLGIDLVIAITVSWVPLVSDYTRFARDKASAFWGSGAGYFIGGTWMLGLGVLIVSSRGLSDPVEIPPAVAAAGIGAALALLAVTIDETDEAFANVYSTAVSIQNVAPQLPQSIDPCLPSEDLGPADRPAEAGLCQRVLVEGLSRLGRLLRGFEQLDLPVRQERTELAELVLVP